MTAAPGMPLRSCLYEGKVMHRRLAPAHRFGYRLFWLLVDLDELDRLDRDIPLLAVNRAGLCSFHERDHGPRDGTPLRPWIEARLAEAGIDIADGTVRLLCLPRILGYAFNPLSIWFCHDGDGRLAAVLYEVANTFGERHCYLFRMDGAPAPHGCAKEFYVSPFTDMATRYAFRLLPPDAAMSLHIRQYADDGAGEPVDVLIATMAGRRVALSGRTLVSALRRYPLVTVKVIAGILWEAGRLWRKGARPRPRPAPPADPVTIVSATPAPARAAA